MGRGDFRSVIRLVALPQRAQYRPGFNDDVDRADVWVAALKSKGLLYFIDWNCPRPVRYRYLHIELYPVIRS